MAVHEHTDDAVFTKVSKQNQYCVTYCQRHLHTRTYLLAEVDGDVGYGQRDEESDERPVVRQRRECHHVVREEHQLPGSRRMRGRSQPVVFERFLAETRRRPCPPTQQQHHKQWSRQWENRRVSRNFCWGLLHCSPIRGEEKTRMWSGITRIRGPRRLGSPVDGQSLA